MTKRKFVTIIPAGEGWTAMFSENGEPAVYPVACWALMEYANGNQAVIPMVTVSREVALVDEFEERTLIGISRGP